MRINYKLISGQIREIDIDEPRETTVQLLLDIIKQDMYQQIGMEDAMKVEASCRFRLIFAGLELTSPEHINDTCEDLNIAHLTTIHVLVRENQFEKVRSLKESSLFAFRKSPLLSDDEKERLEKNRQDIKDVAADIISEDSQVFLGLRR